MEFKVADILVCKNSKPLQGNEVAPPLTEGIDYVVEEVLTCQCGSKHLDMGLRSQYNFINCFECGEELPRGKEIHWCHPSRFEAKS